MNPYKRSRCEAVGMIVATLFSWYNTYSDKQVKDSDTVMLIVVLLVIY